MAARFALALIGLLLVAPAGARAAVAFGAPAALQPVVGDTPPCCTDRYLGAPTAPSDGVLVRWTLRRLVGGAKGDELHGDAGNDQLALGTGRDRVWGGPGNDTISARDGSRDVIDCGAGLDRVTADRRDRVRGCERVSRR